MLKNVFPNIFGQMWKSDLYYLAKKWIKNGKSTKSNLANFKLTRFSTEYTVKVWWSDANKKWKNLQIRHRAKKCKKWTKRKFFWSLSFKKLQYFFCLIFCESAKKVMTLTRHNFARFGAGASLKNLGRFINEEMFVQFQPTTQLFRAFTLRQCRWNPNKSAWQVKVKGEGGGDKTNGE